MGDSAGRCFESAVRTRCCRGEVVSGDLALLVPVRGSILVAAIDGAGHGPQAAGAAHRAAAVLQRAAQSGHSDVRVLMRETHLALRETRGAAISLASLSCTSSTMTWLGVGNVEGRVLSPDHAGFRRHESLRMLGGVAGHDLPTLTSATLEIHRGDLIAFASDGVARRFADRLDPAGSPAAIAARILADHWDGEDDALVIVLRWLGDDREDAR